MAKRSYRKMTADERARQYERQRFIDDVVASAAARAGIANTPAERSAHVQSVVDAVAVQRRARRSG